jgi:predicted lipoprotein with Yx(FWY)xxD motif
MHKLFTTRRRVVAGGILVLALLATALVGGASAAPAAPGATMRVARTVDNKTLGKTILVNRAGHTLYFLTAETRTKFICTNSSCTSLWTPLAIPRAKTPTGVSFLGTTKRPTGQTQVTYRGHPLYTFNEDKKPGDVKGNGFKDVGTWLAATPTSTMGAKTAKTAPSASSGSSGYGY